MAKDSYCEHLADGEHTVLPVVAYGGHCLLPVLGDGNTRLTVCKDRKNSWFSRTGKFVLTTLCTILWTWLCLPLLVTLLPPRYRQLCNGSTSGLPRSVWDEKISLYNGLDLGGAPDLLPIPACRLPDCHHRIARASSQMHHRSK